MSRGESGLVGSSGREGGKLAHRMSHCENDPGIDNNNNTGFSLRGSARKLYWLKPELVEVLSTDGITKFRSTLL